MSAQNGFGRVAIRATECSRAALRSGPAGRLLPPPALIAHKKVGENPPRRQGSGQATSAASSPLFRARKASLVQSGCPSAPVVLDCTPPFPFGLAPPSRRKNAIRVSRKGAFNKKPAGSKAPVGRRGILHRQPLTLSASHAACLCWNFWAAPLSSLTYFIMRL